MSNILLIIGVLLGCWVLAGGVLTLGYVIWHIFFGRDDGTHITRSVRRLWEDEDEN